MKKLILISLSGNWYGVWKEDVLDIISVNSVHGLPLLQKHLAGIGMADGGRLVTFLDLGVCMGHAPFDRSRPGVALIVSGGEGFIAGLETREADVPPGDVVSMPEYLNAPELDRCALVDGEPVPVINIGVLYKSIGQGRSRPRLSFKESAWRRALGPVGDLRTFGLGGLPFALPGEPEEWEAAEPGRIRPLPLAAKHIEGIVFRNGRISAVVDPAKRMGFDGCNGPKVLFIDGSGGPCFVADSDRGPVSGTLKPMPPLVSSSFMRHCLVGDGEVIPVVDTRALLSGGEEAATRRYSPSIEFASTFGKENASVLELSIAGVRHSLPSPEVGDVFEFRPYRELPEGRRIACGIIEHEGEILPIVDLAICFGRRTGAGAKMVLIKNGDFRAIVLADDVSENRRTLPVEEQRRLPIRQSENYVYGCYLDGTKVRLVLNVEALAANFVKEEMGGYFSRMVEELENVPETRKTLSAPRETSVAQGAGDGGTDAGDRVARSAVDGIPAVQSVSLETRHETEFQPIKPPAEDDKAQGRGQKSSGGKVGPQTDTAQDITQAEGPRPSDNAPYHLTDEDKTLEAYKLPVDKVSRTGVRYRIPFLRNAHGEDPRPDVGAEDEKRRGSETGPARAGQKLSFGGADGPAEPVYQEAGDEGPDGYLKKKRGRKRRVWGAIIGSVVLVVMYFALWPARETPRPARVKAVQFKEPEKPATRTVKAVVLAKEAGAAAGAAPSGMHAASEGRRPAAAASAAAGPHGAEIQKKPLLLEIRPAKQEISAKPVVYRPYGTKTYTIVRGDTLWDIAQRFTGDPFKYHKMAADSKIKDPDLIFPGQRIFILIEK